MNVSKGSFSTDSVEIADSLTGGPGGLDYAGVGLASALQLSAQRCAGLGSLP